MRNGIVILLLIAFATTGCYRVTVETGAPPGPAGLDVPWQMSFAAGLIPPPEVDTSEECSEGVAQVQTQRSFLNALATGITSNILSPLHVTVVCAAGPVRAGQAGAATEPDALPGQPENETAPSDRR